MALYCLLREPSITRIRRAELKQGEVKAEPVDFMLDIEIKATKALNDPFSEDMWENVLDDPESYPDLPEPIQMLLGKAFIDGHLDSESDYRMLYFKIRNEQVRRTISKEGEAHV